MADETITTEVDALAASLAGDPAPSGDEAKPNGDATPETEDEPEAPPAPPERGRFASVLEKLDPKLAKKAEPGEDRIAALEATIAELRAAQQKPAQPAKGKAGDVMQAMVQAMLAADPGLDAESVSQDAAVMLPAIQAALSQMQPQTSLSESDRELLNSVLGYAQRASWGNAEQQLTQEFGDEWPELKSTVQQLHQSMGAPEWMESVPMLKLIGHGILAMSGQATASAAQAGKREAVRQSRRQAETTRGADVSGKGKPADVFDFLKDPNLMDRRY